MGGLFVPPRDPRKINKMARKNVKDTTGKGWFDMLVPSITPELKKRPFAGAASMPDPMAPTRRSSVRSSCRITSRRPLNPAGTYSIQSSQYKSKMTPETD
ncbi:hypothetical protein QYE76_023628 [Lolium multiflorum]|uniref:Uncharacterized protein n=1 Tax=Lolium multiflorum TaxID=4521 RepID=A0AAD8VUA4_LOLMU|nr:hypothetical protein QYE76_023628 [Lolium multiflorum]